VYKSVAVTVSRARI